MKDGRSFAEKGKQKHLCKGMKQDLKCTYSGRYETTVFSKGGHPK